MCKGCERRPMVYFKVKPFADEMSSQKQHFLLSYFTIPSVGPTGPLTRWRFMHNIKCTKWNVKWLSNLLIKYKWNDCQAEAISAWKNSFSLVFSNSFKPHDQQNFFCWIKFCLPSLKTFEWHVLQWIITYYYHQLLLAVLITQIMIIILLSF